MNKKEAYIIITLIILITLWFVWFLGGPKVEPVSYEAVKEVSKNEIREDNKLVKRNLCGYNVSFRDTYIDDINVTEKLIWAINNEQTSDYSSQYCKYFPENFTFTNENDFLILNIKQDENFYKGSYYVNFYKNNNYLRMPDFLIDLNSHKIYNINTEDGMRTNVLGEL